MIVSAKHLDEWRFELLAGKHRLVTDQLPEYGGTDQGPMASELLLCSVASCFGQATLHVAERMHKTISNLSLEVEANKDLEVFRFADVTITVTADCEFALLVKITGMAKKYCFVTNSLAIPVKIVCLTPSLAGCCG